MERFSIRRILLACAVGVLGTAVCPTSARAGDVLHLKVGDVQTAQLVQDLTGHGAKTRKLPANFVIQFKNHIRLEDRQNLTSLGARILRYIPDDALLIRATPQLAATILNSSTSIQAIIAFAPQWKLAADFSPLSVFSAEASSEVLIRLFMNEDNQAALQAITNSGINVSDASGRSIVAIASRAQLEKIAEIPAVEWIQPNPNFQTMVMRDLAEQPTPAPADGDYSDLSGFESGGKLLNMETAWSRGLTGLGQVASMADTGLDNGNTATVHQDFSARIPTGLIFGMYSKSWEDPMGHGTHVAGSIAGSGAASGGRLKGGAYQAQFVPESMWSPMLSNLSVPSKLSDLFSKGFAAGARVHSNSWGAAANGGDYDSFSQQVDEFSASNPDLLILFAAGNSGIDANKDGRVDPGSISSPGTAKNVLTVGASKNYITKGGYQMKLSETRLKDSWPVEPLASSRLSENPQGLAAFSSRGPTADGRLKPEIVAPGTNILSVRSQVTGAEPLWGPYNKDYVWSGGTSMATPIAAGAATLTRQYLVENRKIAQPSAALLKAVLMHTATDLFPGQFGAIGKEKGQELLTTRPNNDEGYGRVDLAKSTDLGQAILVDERIGLATGESHSYPVHVSAHAKLTATLVYTDAAAADSAKVALVNDLDLVVVDPNGHQTTLNDHINNNEMIELNVDSGDYQVLVKGTNVPQGPVAGKQSYALVLSVD